MRTRRSLLNFATMILYSGVVMAVGLIASPWLEAWLGPGAFGGYRVVVDLFAYLGLLEFGLGGALAPLLARALGRGDEVAVGRTLAAAVRAYFRVAVLMAAVGLALSPLLPWFASDLPRAGLGDLRRGWLVLLLATVPFALSPFRSVLDARQEGYRINLLLIAQSLVITVAALLLARRRPGGSRVLLANVLGVWTFSLVPAALVLRGDPRFWRVLRPEPIDPEARRALWALSAPALVLSLCGRLGLMTDNLVIGSVLGVEAVTVLFFTQRLAVVGQSLLQGVGGATWAALAELHARGDRDIFNRRLIELTTLVSVLAAAGLGPVVAYNHHFFALWVGRGVAYGGDLVIAVAALNAILQAQTAFWAWCLGATGHMREQVPPAIAWAVLNLVASIVLTHALGVVGPLLGSCVAFLAVNVWALPLLLRRTFATPPLALARAALGPLAWGVPYTAALWWMARQQRPLGWLGLAAEMGAAAIGFLALSAFVIFSRDDRDRWRGRLRDLPAFAQLLPDDDRMNVLGHFCLPPFGGGSRGSWSQRQRSPEPPPTPPWQGGERVRRSMNILTIGHSYVVALNRRLCRELARAGGDDVRVTVAAPAFFQGDLRPIALEPCADEPYRLEPVPVHCSRFAHGFWYGRRLARLLREEHWDVVHAWQEPFIVAGGQIALHAPRGAALVYSTFQNQPKRYPPPFAQIERFAMARASGWTAFGRTVAETLRDRPGYRERPTRVIPLGVDLDAFRPDPDAHPATIPALGWSASGPPVIGFLGRFVPEKGIPLLQRVLDRLGPGSWRALWVGGGPLENDLRDWSRAHGDRVRVVTGVPHDAVPAYLNAMDLLAAPSQTTPRWREQLGRMLLEAMASGVPVVASDSGEIPYVVADAGRIVPEADESAWLEALRDLLASPDRRRDLSARGLTRAREVYACPLIARQFLDFFRERM